MSRAEYLARFNERLARREAERLAAEAADQAALAACTDDELAALSTFWWTLVREARSRQLREQATDRFNAYDGERCRRILARSPR